MNDVDKHFESSECGLLFTTPTVITSDELLEGYNSSAPQQASLRSSWHNLIDLCQDQNSLIYLRLVFPEITLSNDKRIREHLKKFRPLYHHFAKFSGIEIDLTNGLLHSVCQIGSGLKNQNDYISGLIADISEATSLNISVRVSCLQHIHILTSKIPYNKNVSLIHLVDVKASLLKHSSMLGLFSYYNGSDPPISEASVHHDLLLYRVDSFDRIRKHVDLANGHLRPPAAAILEKRYTDPLPRLRNQRPEIRRTNSPMKRRKTGFQDDIEPLDRDSLNSMIPPQDDDLALRIAAWGWTILILVWVTFILGVGSIFGLWDLAMGVPRAHAKENYVRHEKDTGYPIPYYYPNLIVLCCVVAWVWCIVSWMGMKFFRHAKGIDD